MKYIAYYSSPLGHILLAQEKDALVGLWFLGQKHFPNLSDFEERETELLKRAKQWLDICFSGREPDFSLALAPGGTPFQREVWQLLRDIPWGEQVTYGALAARLAEKRGIPSMSAQAVGSAVGRNPISILIPCHRVVGAKGSLTGYAGGLDRKAALLKLEGTM